MTRVVEYTSAVLQLKIGISLVIHPAYVDEPFSDRHRGNPCLPAVNLAGVFIIEDRKPRESGDLVNIGLGGDANGLSSSINFGLFFTERKFWLSSLGDKTKSPFWGKPWSTQSKGYIPCRFRGSVYGRAA